MQCRKRIRDIGEGEKLLATFLTGSVRSRFVGINRAKVVAPKLGSIFKMDEEKFVPRVFPDFWGRPKNQKFKKKT